jgi:hypothetical protein
MCILAIVHNCTIGAEKQGRGLDRQSRPETQIGIHLAACPCVAADMHRHGADERPVHKGVVSASCGETMWNKTDSSLSFRPASS